MKRNIQKVVKCLTCLVTCFVILVCSVTTPAQAAITDTDIFFLTDYSYETIRNEDTTYVDFRIDNPDGGWWQFVNSGSKYISGYEMMYDIPAGSSFYQMDFYYYYLGAEDNGAFEYNYLSLGSYNRYNTLSVDCVFDFTLTYFDSSSGNFSIVWESHVKYYDADFNYLGVVEEAKEITLSGGGTSGNNFDLLMNLDIPDGAAYIVPYQRLSFDFSSYSFTREMSIKVHRDEYFQLGVLFETELSDEEVWDNIVTEGINNASGEIENSGDILGGAVDDLTDTSSKLPTLPGNFSDITGSDDLDASIQDAVKIFDWDKSGLNYMYAPLALSLSLAVMFYIVFGKG